MNHTPRSTSVTASAARLARRVRPSGPLAVAIVASGVALAAVLTTLAWWLPQRTDGAAGGAEPPPEWRRPAVPTSALADRSGVRLVRVAVTGGGGLLDLRFQVVDPDKAAALHDGRTPPGIVDERTGLVFSRLLMDHAHTADLKPAVTYYLVFENTGNWVRRGTEVTVLLGNAQVSDVVVR